MMRFGSATEIAHSILFLAPDEASFFYGAGFKFQRGIRHVEYIAFVDFHKLVRRQSLSAKRPRFRFLHIAFYTDFLQFTI